MKQRLTYEITISEKLEQVTIPNLSDVIWARIETELDNDPGDVGPGREPSPSSPVKGIILSSVVLLFLAAFFLYFFNNDKKTNPALPVSTPANETPLINAPAPAGGQTTIPSFVPLTAPRNAMSPAADTPGKIDTPSAQQVVIDSATILSPDLTRGISTPDPPPVLNADTVPGKKNRGVKGITNDDYKITPKKDST